MKLQLKDLLEAKESYDELMDTKMPPAMAYRVMKAGRVIDREIKDFEEARNKSVKDIGEYDAEAETYTVQPNKVAEFAAALDVLLDQDVELDIQPVSMEMLENGLDEVSPRVLADLWFIFE